MFRYINGFFMVAFILSCAVQYNDPDGLLWGLIYGYAVLLCAMAFEKKFTVMAIPVTLFYVAGAIYMMPGWDLETVALLKEPKMSSIKVEEAREAFGLLICAAWTGVLSIIWYRRRPKGNLAVD